MTLLSTRCTSCGSQLAYAPGTTTLRCSSCGATQEIAAGDRNITEHSFTDWVAEHGQAKVASIGAQVLACPGCGAHTETTDLSGICQFCGGNLVAAQAPADLVVPEAVVPFTVDTAGAQNAFRQWVKSRWFAPNALKKVNSVERLRGTYLPQWTFDAHTETDYTGERGEVYYVTKTRTVPDGQGGTRTETYQERRVKWYPAAGHVRRDFDDILVPATTRIEHGKLEKMGPWPLQAARPFEREYLSGYSALRYDVDPTTGAAQAKSKMDHTITGDVRRNIGGGEQRIYRVNTSYSAQMFKLVLFPLWLATFVYGGRQWQVMVNANTGEVHGERPWSTNKLAVVILVAAILVTTVAFLVGSHAGHSVGSGAVGGPHGEHTLTQHAAAAGAGPGQGTAAAEA